MSEETFEGNVNKRSSIIHMFVSVFLTTETFDKVRTLLWVQSSFFWVRCHCGAVYNPAWALRKDFCAHLFLCCTCELTGASAWEANVLTVELSFFYTRSFFSKILIFSDRFWITLKFWHLIVHVTYNLALGWIARRFT